MLKKSGIALLILVTFLTSLVAGEKKIWAEPAGDYYKAALNAFKQDHQKDAIQYCKQAIHADPSCWQAYQLMASAFYKVSQVEAAVGAGERSLEINPDNPALKDWLSKIEVEQEKQDSSNRDTKTPSSSHDSNNSTPGFLYGYPMEITKAVNVSGHGYEGVIFTGRLGGSFVIWTPVPADIIRLEKKLDSFVKDRHKPKGFKGPLPAPISKYIRQYWGFYEGNRKVIFVNLVYLKKFKDFKGNWKKEVFGIDEMDPGYIKLKYDVSLDKFFYYEELVPENNEVKNENGIRSL